jgi:D-lactate dehydrogenase
VAKILFLEMDEAEAAFVAERLKGHDLRFSPATAEEFDFGGSADTEILSVMVHSKVGREQLDLLPEVGAIATRSTGYDHVDLELAAQRGITVMNVPAYGSNTVAEHTFALILALSRKVHRAYLRLVHGDYSLSGLMGFDLADKTLGVVGAGRIGQHVIRIGRGFGMKVVVFDPFEDAHLSELLNFDYLPFEEVLERSDVIAICCPLTDRTRHLFNRQAFERMRPGALLVNTARGAVVEADALLWALNEGIVAGAGLDVLEGEEMMGEDALMSSLTNPAMKHSVELIAENLALMRHPNVIVTPHMAFYSREALQRILDTTVANIESFLAGNPTNQVHQ